MLERLRTLSPQIFRNRPLYLAEEKSGLPLRLFFMSLWTVADREGRFIWSEDLNTILPYDDVDSAAALDALEKAELVATYWHDGKRYGTIPDFLQWQRINNKESPSRLPDPKLANGIRLRRSAGDTETLTIPGLEAQTNGTAKRRAPAEPVKRSWSYRAIQMYGDRMGGSPPAGKITKFIKPLIEKYGEDLVLAAWEIYLSNKEPEFVQPSDFATHFNLWTPEGFKAQGPRQNGRKRGTPPSFSYNGDTQLPPEQD